MCARAMCVRAMCDVSVAQIDLDGDGHIDEYEMRLSQSLQSLRQEQKEQKAAAMHRLRMRVRRRRGDCEDGEDGGGPATAVSTQSTLCPTHDNARGAMASGAASMVRAIDSTRRARAFDRQ